MKNFKIILLIVIISACSSDDDNTNPPPQVSACDISTLNFVHVLDFQSDGNCLSTSVTDAVLDPLSNILYFTSRGINSGATPGQEIIRIDLNTNSVSKDYGINANNFCTTRPMFFNNQLYVASSWHISTYGANGDFVSSTDYSIDPSNTSIFGIGSWFDATYDYDNDEIYFIGAREEGLGGGMVGNQLVRKYDLSSNSFNTVGSLTTPVTLVGAEYYDDNLYVFGGYDNDALTSPLNQVQRYNLTTGVTTTETLTNGGAVRGFITRADSCIFGAGNQVINVSSGNDVIFYKYNTINEVITVIPHNLTFTPAINNSAGILAIAASETKLYVVTKSGTNSLDEYSVYEATLL